MSERLLIIGSKRFSSWSLRPWLMLKQAGLPFEEILIPLRQPDTKARILEHSPSGKVPLLKDHGLLIWDSLAIGEYLAEQVPGLWPSDPAARALARSLSAEMHSGFQALRQLMPMSMGPEEIVQPERTPELLADIARIETAWQDARTRFGAAGPWLFGAWSIADAMFAPVVSRFTSYGVTLEKAEAQAYREMAAQDPLLLDWVRAAQAEG